MPVYYPDDGKIFIKGGEDFTAVILQEGENIEDYIEVEHQYVELNT